MKTHPYLNTEDVTTSFLNERYVGVRNRVFGRTKEIRPFNSSSDITRGFSNQEQYQNNMNMVNLSESDITTPSGRKSSAMNHCQSGFSIDPE